MRAKEFTDQYPVKHEFVKRLHRRYAKEGIVIPYPIRAINYDQEKAGS
jgi:small-conductance mechanosensitive channel